MQPLIDKDLIRYSDLFVALLVSRAQESVLPELNVVFGDKIIQFLDIFAGATFEVPSRKILEDVLRDVSVYYRRKAGTHRLDLANTYEITETKVEDICQRVSKIARLIDE